MKITHKNILFISVFFIQLFSCSQGNISDIFSENVEYEDEDKVIENDPLHRLNYLSPDEQKKSWIYWLKNQDRGNLFITNFEVDKNIEKENWAIIQDDNNIMLFANRNGILTYDGIEWYIIQTTGFPYSIVKDTLSDRVFVGCSNGFGYLTKDIEGQYFYKPVKLGIKQNVEITDILINGQYIYVYNEDVLCRLDITDFENQICWKADAGERYAGIFKCNEDVFVNVSGKNLRKVENDDLVGYVHLRKLTIDSETGIKEELTKPVSSSFSLKDREIIFSIPFDKKWNLIGTNDTRLFLFDGLYFFDYFIEDQEFIIKNVLADCINLSDEEFAIATLTGGCLIVDKKTGKTRASINYQTGLPDDEIFSLGTDNNNGLWISHGFGISRANLSVPVLNYDSYLGLEGNINAIYDADTTVYVATSEGIFYLQEVKDRKEIEVLVRKKKAVTSGNRHKNQTNKTTDSKKSNTSTETNNDNKENTKTEENKSGFLQKWRDIRKRKKEKEKLKEIKAMQKEMEEIDHRIAESDNENKEEEKKTETEEFRETTNQSKETISEEKKKQTQEKYRTVIESEKREYVESLGLMYKKVRGINEKCKQIVKVGNKLLTTTNTGLYQIVNKHVDTIINGRYVNCIAASKDSGNYWIGTNTGILSVKFEDKSFVVNNPFDEFKNPVYSLIEDRQNNLWLGSENIAYRIPIDSIDFKVYHKYSFLNDYPEIINVREENSKPVFYLSSGVYGYDEENNIMYKKPLFPNFIPDSKYIFSQNNISWISKDDNWMFVRDSLSCGNLITDYLNLFPDIQNIHVDSLNNLWVITGDNRLYKIVKTDAHFRHNFDIFIKQIANAQGYRYPISDLSLKYNENALGFEIAAPFFIVDHSAQFQYIVEGLTRNWTIWNNKPVIELPYIPPGKYVLEIRAKNILNDVSPVHSFKFSVTPPFWQSMWFFVIAIVFIVIAIYLLIKRRERKLHLENIHLEIKVMERTEEIRKQKQKIMDSIAYARRIQNAILPPDEIISEILPDHFIFNQPKDVVSGDYYWITQKEQKIYVAVADCTGHGVPGAFLSMLGISFLNEIVNKKYINKAHQMLGRLRESIITSLHQTGKEGEAQDGMDIALCIIDKQNMKVEFAGAYNPMYLIRNKELVIIKADRMPIGIFHRRALKPFTNHEMEIKEGDQIYMFSDGYVDQSNMQNKKFLTSRFKQLLVDNCDKPMEEQNEILKQTIDDWKGEKQQIDDILVMGIKI